MCIAGEGRSLVIELYEHRLDRERVAIVVVFNRENEAGCPICEWGHGKTIIHLPVHLSLPFEEEVEEEEEEKEKSHRYQSTHFWTIQPIWPWLSLTALTTRGKKPLTQSFSKCLKSFSLTSSTRKTARMKAASSDLEISLKEWTKVWDSLAVISHFTGQ